MKEGKIGSGMIRIAVPVETRKGLSSPLSEHLGMCPYFLICDLEAGKVKELKTRSNPGAKVEVRMGLEAARFLIDQDVDVVLVFSMGEGPYWMLKSNSVRMYKILRAPGTKEEFEHDLENYEELPEIIK